MSVNIIKKCIFLCKLCNCHSHKYTNGDDDQSGVYYKKYLFIQLWETLTCPEIPEADHGECISCKPKTEKWLYNEDAKILKKFSSHLKPKTWETEGAEGKCCGSSNSVHPIWGPCWVWFWYLCFAWITCVSSKETTGKSCLFLTRMMRPAWDWHCIHPFVINSVFTLCPLLGGIVVS